MQKVLLRHKGLHTDANRLSAIPEGALIQAENVVIDRDDIVEQRRGFKQFGNNFGIGTDLAKQLLSYKDRILVHYNDKLLYNNNQHDTMTDGNFLQFSGSYSELETGRRIRAIESNKNMYFTTSDGIKKISAKTASDFTTSSGFIVDAGVPEALDLTGELDFTVDGFLPPNSKVAYRIVFGYKDDNNNVLLGAPSSRIVLTNFSTDFANINLQFVLPQNLTDVYFYQVYRTAVFTATAGTTLDLIDPGDDMNLVIEDFPTSAELSAKFVTVNDVTPEDFRANGLPLYTSPNVGDGISASNNLPPKAKDITLFQSTAFYANTETIAQTTISLLSVANLVSGTSSVTIQGPTNQTYTFFGTKESTRFNFTSYTGTIPTNLNGKYFLFNSSSNKRKYFAWYDTTKTTQTITFTNYVGVIPGDLDGRYFILNTSTNRKYYVWYDATGTTQDPIFNVENTNLSGLLGIKVDISFGVTTKAQVASATNASITSNNVFNDFDINYTPGNMFLSVDTESFDVSQLTLFENIQKGFQFTINTPTDANPANDLLVHTDVVGRTGFKINVSRGITTKAQLAEKTATSINDQDEAFDFTVSYTATNQYFDIENTNNGKTDDAVDSAIDGIANSFAITILSQGDGEDATLKKVLLSAAQSPAQQIDETARSLVNVINKNASDSVYAFYISGPTDLPGQIVLKSRDLSVTTFSVISNNAATGDSFNPSLPPAVGADPVTANSEIKPNRLYFAKLQQPEAVPALNFIDIGPEDKEISRILALRESLFVLKRDGVYRLTGFNGQFSVDLFDESTKILAPDSAVVLNNQIFCLTNQGVVQISDTGVRVVSDTIDTDITTLTSSNYNFKFTTFGISYETDRAYVLWVVKTPNDIVATQAYRYNTKTEAWTIYSTDGKTCGLVNEFDDRLYLGPSDINFIEQERKLFNRTDYADREFLLSVPSTSVINDIITLSSSQNIQVGDVLVQTQNLTIPQYNQLLKKLDLDPQIGQAEITQFNFGSYAGSLPTSLQGKYFTFYSASDAVKYVAFFDANNTIPVLNTTVNVDAAGANQIRIDISAITTLAQLTDVVQNTIKSSTLDFNVTYIPFSTSFTIKTVRSGVTTDAQDGVINPLANGFAINVLQIGFGDYFTVLEALPGDNLKDKLDDLALKLDADPGVIANDFLAAIDQYSGTGASTTIGLTTQITIPAHSLQSGRIITISNSTTTPNINGNYVLTKVNANTISIPVQTTVAGTVDWDVDANTFEEYQGMFNCMVKKLNNDAGVLFSNYLESSGTSSLESLILTKINNTNRVVLQYALPLIVGPITSFRGIKTLIVYAPDPIGDTSIKKHIREGTFIFENTNFNTATVSYKTDLSPGFEDIFFARSGNGDWGGFVWGGQNWGGGFSGVPLRTYIPASKQRCRYIQAKFVHVNAREKWAIYGISYTYRALSEKAYRD